MDGIVVTNHAGRQVDGAVGSLEILPAIVDAVREREKVRGAQGECESAVQREPKSREEHENIKSKERRMTILFDSGIRTGSDIIKAIALGADAVLVGRYVTICAFMILLFGL